MINKDMSYRDLREFDAVDMDLRWANFTCANLSGADFERANLRWANFDRADITNADFSGANLRFCINLDKATGWEKANFGNAIMAFVYDSEGRSPSIRYPGKLYWEADQTEEE